MFQPLPSAEAGLGERQRARRGQALEGGGDGVRAVEDPGQAKYPQAESKSDQAGPRKRGVT